MKRDFSDSAYNELIGLVKEVENERWGNFTDYNTDGWCNYSEPFGIYDVAQCIDAVNNYHKYVIEKNDATKATIDKIFADVKNIDQNYAVRFVSYQTRLMNLIALINEFSNTVNPSNGVFDPGELPSLISKYENEDVILKILGNEGLTEEDIDGMDESETSIIANKIIPTVIDLLPNLKVGSKVEIPIGPGATAYYSIKSEIKGNSDIDINMVVEDQKLKLKNLSISKDTGGDIKLGVEGNTDKEINFSYEAGSTSISLNNKLEFEESASLTVGNNTYTVKSAFSLKEVKFEESVKTEFDAGSVTSTIGVKKTTDNDWTSLPPSLPVEEYKPAELPHFKTPDIDWEYVEIGAIAVVVVVCVIWAPELIPILIPALSSK